MTRLFPGFIVLGFCTFFVAPLAAQQCTPPPSGMVAWYTGDGTANDYFGNNNGSPQNGAAFATGMVGQAFSLNGINQSVTLPVNLISYPTMGATGTQPLSVDAWFQTTAGGVILSQQGAGDTPVAVPGSVPAIYVGTDGFLYTEVFWKGAAAPVSSAPVKVNDGAFHLVAVTYDGSMETVYLDGKVIGSAAFTQVGYAARYQYQIGTGNTAGWPAGNGGSFYFKGLIDEVEFFNRALTPSDIGAILNAGSAGKCKVSSGACTIPPAGLVTWYTGDGTANDFYGKSNGTLQNGASFASGLVGQAFSLNGSGQFVSLPANVIPYPATGVTTTQAVSVDAWFATTSGGVILGQQSAIVAAAAPTGAVPAIYVGKDGFLYAELFWKGATAPLSSAPAKVNDGAFHLVAVTYDGSTETLHLDGTLLATGPFVQTGYASNYQYQIGTGFTAGWPAGNGAYFDFQGLIDEVEIFNRALSLSDIQAIFNARSAGKCKNQAPIALCKNVTVSACAANASIDNGSYDPDGDTVTLTQAPPGPYPVGATTVTLTATDSHGASSQCAAVVTVTASTAASVSLSAQPSVLWPPNHKMVAVTITSTVSGNCGAVTCKITSVTSNEPIDGDVDITGDLTVNLRAQRAGNGDGRVYQITVQCTDAAGNVTTKTVTVTVPHDQGQGGGNDQGGDGQGDNNQGGDGQGGDQGNQRGNGRGDSF